MSSFLWDLHYLSFGATQIMAYVLVSACSVNFPKMLTFFGSRHCSMHMRHCAYSICIRWCEENLEKGWNCSSSVDLSLFVMNKLNCKYFFIFIKNKHKTLTVQMFCNIQITPFSTQRKGCSTKQEKESALLVHLYIISFWS